MKDFASPNSSLQPQGSNNARFSPRSRHTSPQGGTAAYSLQSTVTESQSKHHKDKSGRSLLSRLLSLNANTLARNNSGESEVKDGEILKSPPPVSERSSLTTASRVENGAAKHLQSSPKYQHRCARSFGDELSHSSLGFCGGSKLEHCALTPRRHVSGQDCWGRD